MSSLAQPAPRVYLKAWILGLAVSLIALLPWWHNHDYLKDFYDYGLFINVNTRLAQGQKPFVDFTTPAQSATSLLNYAAESVGGGSYVAMTYGAAGLIVLGGLGLTLLLARRLNPWAAALIALAIVAGSASQHTIVFYNPLGVLATAMTVWGFAAAPLLRRQTAGWHVLAAAGLFLGGLNKINFHLLACAMAVGWIIYAWIGQPGAAIRAILTLVFAGMFGFLLPIGLEILWTGAGWSGWFYNVVELPLGARGSRISYLFSPRLYLTTLHNYYGELRVPQIGLIGVLMPLMAVIAAWRVTVKAGQKWRAFFLILAGLLAAFSSSALLLTNNEIAYITFAAALVITVGLWLGFGAPPRGGWFVAGALMPALLLAATGWESAWHGERSQFGHDIEPRQAYWPGETIGTDFGYLRGLKIPPGMAQSLSLLASWREKLPEQESRRIYYGPGAEWLERIWPVHKVRGLPLVTAAFEGEREVQMLEREVITGDTFAHLVSVEAWDHWNAAVQAELSLMTVRQKIGSALVHYRKLPSGTLSARPLDFMHSGFGGNVDSMRVVSDLTMHTLTDDRRFLGTGHASGTVDVDTPCQRMSAEYVLMRPNKDEAGPISLRLSIDAKMDSSLLPRWAADVTLPDGASELVVQTAQIDGSGLPLRFSVTIPEESSGKVIAGWRAFQLWDTPDRENAAPILRPSIADLLGANEDIRKVLAPVSLRDTPVYLRGGRAEADGLLLPAGGEVWLRMQGLYTDINILARLLEPEGNDLPELKVVYYKGGRLERVASTADESAGTLRFSAWTPETGGWIGILADPQPGSPSMLVKIETATRH
ncbi:MAG: hypothetical protein RLZZ129_1588 [Verrucomicrobiota bacterium]|jgi:hypothetical protein